MEEQGKTNSEKSLEKIIEIFSESLFKGKNTQDEKDANIEANLNKLKDVYKDLFQSRSTGNDFRNKIKIKLSTYDNEKAKTVSYNSETFLNYINNNNIFDNDECELKESIIDFINFINETARERIEIPTDEKNEISQSIKLESFILDIKEEFENYKKIAKNADEVARAANKVAKDANKVAKDANKAAKDANKTIENIIPNVITVLGILVSIIIAVVACYITVLITENDKTSFFLPNTLSTPFKIIRYIIMGHIILSVVFLLLYLVGKLTSRSLATSCTMFYPNCDRCIEDCEYKKINPAPECPKYSDQCAICKKECTWRKRLRRKYPYVFAINIIFLIGYAVLLVWHFLSVHFSSKIDELIDSCPWWIPTIGLAVFFALFFLVIFLIFNNKKDAPIPNLPDREANSITERKEENP